MSKGKRKQKQGNKSKSVIDPKVEGITEVNETDKDNALECSKYVFEQVNKWIENADNKVNISCAIFTLVFGILSFLNEKVILIPDNPIINEFWSGAYIIMFGLSLLFFGASIVSYISAIYPNLKSNNKERKKYPIYYGDIQSLNIDEYKKTIEKATNEDFYNEIVAESHFNSSVCMNKMKRYRNGLCMSMFAILFMFLSLIAHYLMYH